jgi:uncharacterized protein (DUF488 family)
MPQVNRLTLPTLPLRQQLENKSVWNRTRSIAIADFFTIGYTGRKTEDIIAALMGNRVRTLVDVRQHAVSMYRPDLSKTNLCRLVEANGIGYAHFPQFGVPRDIRAKAIEWGTRDVIWTWYDRNVLPSFLKGNLHYFLNCVDHPVALMCTEVDPQECHRHRLCLALENLGMRGYDL